MEEFVRSDDAARAKVYRMKQLEEFDQRQAHRRERLRQAVEHHSKGNRNAFGKALGFASGAWINQMLSGSKSINESTIYKIERLPGMSGWFEEPPSQLAKVSHASSKLEAELEVVLGQKTASEDLAQALERMAATSFLRGNDALALKLRRAASVLRE